ncbi:hypothetical protein Cni_G17922 [Canna indica]|uniref:Uncharacterized protein n=1 Tax=Canna indica TaxID=4628 RepID=A0AAQ3KIH7_9LILI|nr:hypothetical protein Cni_G17922 [Canna indica]
MEAPSDQSATPAPVVGSSKLRYPLRSASRSKDGKPTVAEPTVSSTSKSDCCRNFPSRVRASPAVNRSVSIPNVSGKETASRPPRRLSIPTKPVASPVPVGSITPTSETRPKRLNTQGKNDTPLSELSKSTNRRKFCVLSSVSYWLTQIKLSESASKHSISLGFFKLALESGCEPLDRVREELKSYIQRHNLVAEQEDFVKDLLQCYNIMEDLEKLKVSEACSKLAEDVAQKSDKDTSRLASKARNRRMASKSVDTDTLSPIADSNKKDGLQKRQLTYTNKGMHNKNTAKVIPTRDNNSTKTQKKPHKSRTESVSGDEKIKTALDNSPAEPGDKVVALPTEEALNEDKENMHVHTFEEDSSTGEEVPVN